MPVVPTVRHHLAGVGVLAWYNTPWIVSLLRTTSTGMAGQPVGGKMSCRALRLVRCSDHVAHWTFPGS